MGECGCDIYTDFNARSHTRGRKATAIHLECVLPLVVIQYARGRAASSLYTPVYSLKKPKLSFDSQLGILAPEFGLSFKQSVAASVIGIILGALCTAYTGTLGPKLGLRAGNYHKSSNFALELPC